MVDHGEIFTCVDSHSVALRKYSAVLATLGDLAPTGLTHRVDRGDGSPGADGAVHSVRRIELSAADVYEDLSPAVLGYLRGRGARDPEDLTGDVFVKVTEGFGSFRGDRAALRRWVFTIAHNRLVDEFRREGRLRESLTADRAHSSIDDEMPVDAELLAALTSLTEEQREVVVLRFIADLPLKDVARIVGKRPGAVKMLQARGLATLAAVLTGEKSD